MGLCGGQSGKVTGLCGGLLWTEWQSNRIMWGFVVDRVGLQQVFVGVCCGQSGSVIGLCGDLWWTEWHCNRFMWGFVVERVTL
jgi:hypothetical protein